jgi:hypothetical protein
VLLANHKEDLATVLGELNDLRIKISADIDAFNDNNKGRVAALTQQLRTVSSKYDHARAQFDRKFPNV